MAKLVDGKHRNRPGTWIVDYYEAGQRRWKTFGDRESAKVFLAEVLADGGRRGGPSCDPKIRVADFATRWLEQVKATTKPRTAEAYATIITQHIANPDPDYRVGSLAAARVRDLSYDQIKAFLIRKLNVGRLAPATVRVILAVLRAMLNSARRSRLVRVNPCDGLGRELKLGASHTPDEEVHAMDAEQLERFLTAVQSAPTRYERGFYAMFLCGARAGLRLGELLGLQWGDVDWSRSEMRIQRQMSRGRLGTLKSGKARTVDVSPQLLDALTRLQVAHKTEVLRRGWPEVPAWVFCSEAGTTLDESRTRKVFRKALRRAGLPLHFSPHSLRHTFASQLIAAGGSPEYVRRQLGHASINLTVGTYGRWLPMANKAVAMLDTPAPATGKIEPVAAAVANDVPDVQDAPKPRVIPMRGARGRFLAPLATGSAPGPSGSRTSAARA